MFVKRNNRCLGPHYKDACLKPTNECGINRCQKQHHSLHYTQAPVVHTTNAPPRNPRPPTHNLHPAPADSPLIRRSLVTLKRKPEDTYYRVVPVPLENEGVVHKTYAFLDTGSCVTLIKTSLARKLGLSGERHAMALQCTDTNTTHVVETEAVCLNIRKTSGTEELPHRCVSNPAGFAD